MSRSHRRRDLSVPPERPKAPDNKDPREWEQDKYRWLYREYPDYGAKGIEERVTRFAAWLDGLDSVPPRTLLDIGCGRGRMIEVVEARGYGACGYEVVESLCRIGTRPQISTFAGLHEIPEPNNSWDIVICCDVLEHVLEYDSRAGLAEMIRVAKKLVYLTIDWEEDAWGKSIAPNEVLHINRHDKEWWLNAIADVHVACGDGVSVIREDHRGMDVEISL